MDAQSSPKKRKNFLAALLIICFVILLPSLWLWPLSGEVDSSRLESKKPGPLSQALTGLDQHHLALAGFSSHLPLIIFTPDRNSEDDGQQIPGRIKVVDGPGPANRLADRPATELAVVLNRVAQPLHGGKARFEIRLSGSGRAGLLGLADSDRWLLEGSEADPAMLRNYLAYTLGLAVMGGRAPRTSFCEVFLESEPGRLLYQGIHLFSENPGAAMASDGGRAVPPGVTYVPGPGGEAVNPTLAGGRLRALRPEIEAPDLGRLEAEVNRAKSILRSADPEAYYGYLKVLDVPSCVDTYILNEFMMNYRAEGLPVNIFGVNHRLSLGPVWNFDEALDNTVAPLPDAARNAARTLWLPDLLKSADFVNQYRDRYYRLFRSALNPKRVSDLIDETVIYLGPALVRDWDRWREAYIGARRLEPLIAENGEILARGTRSLDQEIVKIKYNLVEQNRKIRLDLQELRWQPGLIDSSVRVRRNTVISAIFIAAFFTLVHYTRKRY